VLVEQHEHVRIVKLNRPEKKNALSDALGWAIVGAVEDAARDDDVWVVGLTGAGDAFCSGLDLSFEDGAKSASPLSPQTSRLDDLGWVGRFVPVMREVCDKPVVAGVNGVAVGAGLSLAMAADLRIASDRARFLAGYARAGTSPDGGLSWTLPQLIGYERAMRFLLEQRMHSADEALALGLVGEVVAEHEFEQRFLAYCAQLASLSPISTRQTKQMVVQGLLATNLRDHCRDEIVKARRGLTTEDSKEAVKAIMERRPPVFRGR
jgi:2-(1,2-epoxy-1,2-dihydrophenyl)acetyl-CoA isomerase